MKSLIADIGMYQSKVAYLEDATLIDLFVEDKKEKLQGNIYRGIVSNVLPGMEAAFVDIGIDKNGYLPLNKNEKVKKGEEISVQVVKEAIGDKGVKLTREISIPGRYLVFIPTKDDLGISNKIESEEERKRLKEIAIKIKPEGSGLIIRTEGENKEESDFNSDLKELVNMWNEIQKEQKLGIGSKLLYKDLDMPLKIIRDIFNQEFDEVVVNKKEVYEQIQKVVKNIDNSCLSKVKYFEEGIDIFDYYKINKDLKKALSRKVWLRNGGYIIIDKTEALTVIDVNTGKYTGNLGLEETVFKTNCEAAKEIANQIRIRDIGGIIIIDFIDMKSDEYKELLVVKLKKYLQRDKNKSKVFGMTNLGLVEVVRKKSKDTIDNYFKMKCVICKGEGNIKSINSVLDEIEKEVIRLKKHTNCKSIIFNVSSYIYRMLEKNKFNDIKNISSFYNFNINIEEDSKLGVDSIEVVYDKN